MPVRVSGPRGTKDLDALLDTGATYCILSPDDVEDLGYTLKPAPLVRVATAGGLIVLPQLTLTAMEVLGFRRLRIPTLIKDLSDSGLQAVIGWSFLDHFRLILDPRRRYLELSTP